MKKTTPQQTETMFGLGNGIYNYPWWSEAEATTHGLSTGLFDDSSDDWHITITLEDPETTVVINHTNIMRTVHKIAAKDGADLVTSATRKECQTLLFKGFDEADFDADTGDQVIQILAFGKLFFG